MQTSDTNESFNLSMRSEDSNKFNWKAHCFLRGEIIVIDKKHPDRIKKILARLGNYRLQTQY